MNLVKILKAIDLLAKPGGVSIDEMMDHLELKSKKSFYNTIKRVEALGFPVYDDKDFKDKRKRRWKLEESYVKKLPNMNIPDTSLTYSEILSLYMLKSKAALFQDTEIEKHIQSAYTKFGLFLPENIFKKLDKIKPLFISLPKSVKDYSGKEEIIEQLTDAMLNLESCYVKYNSFGRDKVTNFAIDPLHFFENNNGLYLLVNASSFGEIRTLAVERIMEITKAGVLFEYPENFNPNKLMENAFDIVFDDPIDIKVWFSADQARYIKERKWAENQEIDEQADGSIILVMHTSGSWDVKKWILSYGADARVLEPEILKTEIIKELNASILNY